MINAKTKNALTAISILSFGADDQQGIWKYGADVASNANAPATPYSGFAPRAATIH